MKPGLIPDASLRAVGDVLDRQLQGFMMWLLSG
jgi:hypothetical protein